MKFSHLHVHTQFSLLDGAADIGKLYKKAIADNMPAIAITDHGNMFGVFDFVAEAYKHKNADGTLKVKPIVGCEFYLVADRTIRSFTKEFKDKRFHQLILAKNEEGYRNLIKLCSLGYTEGLYGKYPRIDKDLVLKYHTGLIATTCCLGASVPRTILSKGEEAGEIEFKWWLDLFGEDYYIELQRHDIADQNKVNEVLLKWAVKYNVKVIASNDSHYVDQIDANAHDILLCINTGQFQSTPKMSDFADDDVFVKGRRFAFANDQFFFKNTKEMTELFKDVPQAIDNTNEIVDKVDLLKLTRDVLLPNYEIPKDFFSQEEYLKHLTFLGAKNRYKELSPEIEERINFELHTINTMGFAGYFLIVADFIKAGRDIGVFVGPGRGSAAGSVVAYCTGITNIDPIKYNLLFERFLNPERKSLPDIDTDFDDAGRQKVIDYVVQKYGRNQVAQIVTYGTMAAKSSIKDVARVMELPIADSNALTKLVPERAGIELGRLLHAPIEGEKSLAVREGLDADEIEDVKKLRSIYNGNDLQARILKEAEVLEGSVRGTGVHAAGLIIAPKDLTEIIPIAVAKDSDLVITQFEGKVIEDAGILKMDFLGLRNLTILKDAKKLIKKNHGIDIDFDEIPLDDKATLELFGRGETIGTFQFESVGMQKYLKELKPDKFDDLVAMNALYRPGPLAYIPNFINRKHGREKITYDLPEMEEFLKDTYGVTVYQEQVMLLSQKLADFTKGDADTLRKAMGKKDKQTLDDKKNKFIEGGMRKGFAKNILEKIWTDWEAFAQYAFNKSHSVCYAYVAFHTGYLKAHYPAEYMASVLGNNLSNIDKVSFFVEECKRMNIPVLGPEVNESELNFSVNKKGEIRYALAAIKGVGDGGIEKIIEERKERGNFTSIFDLSKRVNLRAVNKKTFEGLALSGAFDCFVGTHRAQYFAVGGDGLSLIEKAIRYGNTSQLNENINQQSLFGGANKILLQEPTMPITEEWTMMQKLKEERDVIGMYISGHPLDTFKLEIEKLCTQRLTDFKTLSNLKNKEVKFAGIVTVVDHRTSKAGKPYGRFTLEDYTGTYELALFGDDYLNNRKYMESGYFLFLKGRIMPRWNKQDDFEVKLNSIEMLADVRTKYFKNIYIEIKAESIDKDFLKFMLDQSKNFPGQCALNFVVIENTDVQPVIMRSSKFRINASNELLSNFDQFGLNYKLN